MSYRRRRRRCANIQDLIRPSTVGIYSRISSCDASTLNKLEETTKTKKRRRDEKTRGNNEKRQLEEKRDTTNEHVMAKRYERWSLRPDASIRCPRARAHSFSSSCTFSPPFFFLLCLLLLLVPYFVVSPSSWLSYLK